MSILFLDMKYTAGNTTAEVLLVLRAIGLIAGYSLMQRLGI